MSLKANNFQRLLFLTSKTCATFTLLSRKSAPVTSGILGSVGRRPADHRRARASARGTRRRIHPFDFCALSFERHGFWAKETVSSTRKLAHARASALGLDPSAEICRWYGIISCCIQRANAKVLRGEPVPARHSPPPVRLFSMGRDLPLSR